MRIFRIMAAVGKAKPPISERVPSAGLGNTQRGQAIRAFHPNSSPVYKTQSDTSLTSGVRNLTLRDTQPNKRTLTGRTGSGNGIIKNVSDVASLLQNESVKNVVVVAGAGISTPSGIPDFRSPGTGLYDNLQQYQIPYPEAIFDIDYFHQNPRPFFTLAKELYPTGKYRPNYIHYFIRLLHNKGMLLRMYTQNIDGLERLAGVPPEKLVEAHGTFAQATCTLCGVKTEGEEVKEKIFADKLPRCKTKHCIGIMKPDIVFFGEDLPSRFYCYLKDMLQTDLVIVMGTSLEVQPFAGIIDTVRWTVPRLLFNRNAVGPFRYNKRSKDLVSPGDLIDNIQKFVGMAGWKSDMVELITEHEGSFKVATRVTRRVPRGVNPVKPIKPTTTTKKPVVSGKKAVGKSSAPPPSENSKNTSNRSPSKGNYSNLLYRQNAQMDIYRYRNSNVSSSSSESETESETSSESEDSSEEEDTKSRNQVTRNRFTGMNRNGAGAKNGYRSSSAKIGNSPLNKKPDIGSSTGNPNKTERKFTTGAAPSVTVDKGGNSGNLTGRSVKLESGLGKGLGKRHVDIKKPDRLPNDRIKISNEVTAKADKVFDLRRIQNDVPTILDHQNNDIRINNDTEMKAVPYDERAKDQDSDEISSVQHRSSRESAKTSNETSLTKPERPKESIKTGSSSFTRSEREKVLQKYGLNTFSKEEEKQTKMDTASNASGPTSTVDQKHRKGKGPNIALLKKYCVNLKSPKPDGEIGKKLGAESSNGVTAHEQTKSDASVANVVVIENGNILSVEEGDGISLKDTSSLDGRLRHKIALKTREKNNLLKDKNFDGGQVRRKQGVETPEKNHLADKPEKVAATKTGKVTPVLRKQIENKLSKDGSRKSRKPPTGKKHKHKTKKRDLNSVNARPYGYANIHKPPMQPGIGPFKRTNVRALNSSINSDPFPRSGSAELPRINYRHRLHPPGFEGLLGSRAGVLSDFSDKSDNNYSDEDLR